MSEEKRLLREALKHLRHTEYANGPARERLDNIRSEIETYLANPDPEPAGPLSDIEIQSAAWKNGKCLGFYEGVKFAEKAHGIIPERANTY